jgi:hypothetical protein
MISIAATTAKVIATAIVVCGRIRTSLCRPPGLAPPRFESALCRYARRRDKSEPIRRVRYDRKGLTTLERFGPRGGASAIMFASSAVSRSLSRPSSCFRSSIKLDSR